MASSKAWMVAAALALGGSGCFFGDHHDDDDQFVVTGGDPVLATIDAGRELSTELGEGAGLFVEYAQGGKWRLWSSCDTLVTADSCTWEASVRAHSVIGSVSLADAEGVDRADLLSDDELAVLLVTDTDQDVVDFTAAAGALVEVEVLLDGVLAPAFVIWIGNGTVHNGAASSPVVFNPDVP